jgi:hypothetical protein
MHVWLLCQILQLLIIYDSHLDYMKRFMRRVLKYLELGVFKTEERFELAGYCVGDGLERGQEDQSKESGCGQSPDDGDRNRSPHLSSPPCRFEKLGEEKRKR